MCLYVHYCTTTATVTSATRNGYNNTALHIPQQKIGVYTCTWPYVRCEGGRCMRGFTCSSLSLLTQSWCTLLTEYQQSERHALLYTGMVCISAADNWVFHSKCRYNARSTAVATCVIIFIFGFNDQGHGLDHTRTLHLPVSPLIDHFPCPLH